MTRDQMIEETVAWRKYHHATWRPLGDGLFACNEVDWNNLPDDETEEPEYVCDARCRTQREMSEHGLRMALGHFVAALEARGALTGDYEPSALFRMGAFTLHSGGASAFKIDCDALTDEDWQTLAALIVERVPPFRTVEGVPSGGLKLAAALAPYVSAETVNHLIVDDVFTTGGSMTVAKFDAMARMHNDDNIYGAVVFSRGDVPWWVVPVFRYIGRRKVTVEYRVRNARGELPQTGRNIQQPEAVLRWYDENYPENAPHRLEERTVTDWIWRAGGTDNVT